MEWDNFLVVFSDCKTSIIQTKLSVAQKTYLFLILWWSYFVSSRCGSGEKLPPANLIYAVDVLQA